MTDPALEGFWKKIVDSWDDEQAHGAFVEYARSTGQLFEAAVRYRGMAGDHARGASASKRLQAIAVLAMAALESERSLPVESRVDWSRIALIVLFVAGSVALLSALYR